MFYWPNENQSRKRRALDSAFTGQKKKKRKEKKEKKKKRREKRRKTRTRENAEMNSRDLRLGLARDYGKDYKRFDTTFILYGK